MGLDHPYRPPQVSPETRPGEGPRFSIGRALSIIMACGLAASVAGAGIGYALARFVPAYYRSIFEAGDDPGFDPVQVGLGLGISQGLICGLLIGSVIILAEAWTRWRAGDGRAADSA